MIHGKLRTVKEKPLATPVRSPVPASMVDYGKKLDATREAEQGFLAGVVKSVDKGALMPDTADAVAGKA